MLNRPRKKKKEEKLYPKICITNLLCKPLKKNIFCQFLFEQLGQIHCLPPHINVKHDVKPAKH